MEGGDNSPFLVYELKVAHGAAVTLGEVLQILSMCV